MTHEKKSKTICIDLKYNRYMTDDRNRKSGNPVSKKNSKFYNHDSCNKTAIYNYWGMKPKFFFDHKDKYHVNIPKKHILCIIHYISHSPKTKCPKCKIKKSTKCDECYITASYNFEKLRPLKCKKHRKTGIVNIKRNHILCKERDISHSKKTICRKCKLNINNYDNSNSYMKRKILRKLYRKIFKDSKNEIGENDGEKLDNYLNRNNEEVLLYKKLKKKEDRLKSIRKYLKMDIKRKYMNKYYSTIDNKLKTSRKLLNKTGLDDNEILNKFILNEKHKSDDFIKCKNILNKYIKENENDDDIIYYIKLNNEIKLMNNYIDEKENLYKEKLLKERQEYIKEQQRLEKEKYDKNQKEMEVYNKEVCRYTKPGETVYQRLICGFKTDLSHTTPLKNTLVIKDHFDLKFHKDSVNKFLAINVKKSIEDKFIDVIFKFNMNIKDTFYKDLYFKKLFSNTILKNQKEGKKYKYTILMIDASGQKDNIITKKITINDILDYPEFYKDKDLIRFLR